MPGSPGHVSPRRGHAQSLLTPPPTLFLTIELNRYHALMEPRLHRRKYNDPGHAHELTFSCFHRYPFLKSERACQWLADAINAARQTHEFDLWAYVFMPNHFHLIIKPRRVEYDIALIRQAIKEPVARQAFAWLEENAPEWLPRLTVQKNGRERRHFWQVGGGYDRNIFEPRTLREMLDYVHMNPVNRRLVEQAFQWKWSSAAWMFGLGDSPIPLDRIPPDWLV